MTKEKIFHFVWVMELAFFIVSFSTFPVTVHGAQKELLIGTSLPLTGPGASYGIPDKRAQEIAVDQINNAGGVPVGSDRYRLKLLVEDNKYTTKDAFATVNKLVRDDGIRFLRVYGTAPTLATLDFMNKNRIVNFCVISEKGLSPKTPYTFRVYNTTYEVLPPYFSWIRKNMPHIKTIQSLMMDDATGYAITDALLLSTKYFGFDLTPNYAPRNITDFYPKLTEILAKKPDAIYAGGGSNWGMFWKGAREMGFRGQFLGSTFHTEWAEIAGAQNLEGYVHCQVSLTSEALPKGLRDYRNIYLEKYKEEPIGLSIWGFIYIHVLATALQKAGTIDDPDKVKNVLETQTFDTMAGRYMFGGQSFYGTPHQLVSQGFITKFTGGKEVTVEVIPPEQVSELLKKVYK